MADWSRRFTASYRFMRVSRATGLEVGRVGNILSGGTIERNQDTESYESGSVDYVGALDLGADFLRVYLDAEFRDGSTASECLGTFLVSAPSSNKTAGRSTGKAALAGRLSELAGDDFDEPVSIEAGANLVAKAREIAEGSGIEVVADESDAALSTTWVFGVTGDTDDPDSKLAAINKLLDAAGFSAAQADPYGRLLMRRYVEPADRPVELAMAEGPDSLLVDEVVDELDSSEVANVVHAIYSSAEEEVRGTAVDEDPASPWSVQSRGYRKVARYTFQDLPEGETAEERKAAADAKAAELLRTQQAVIHRVTCTHIYAPAAPGAAVTLDYPSAGVSGKFAIRTQSLELTGGCPMTLEVRRYER